MVLMVSEAAIESLLSMVQVGYFLLGLKKV